VGGFHERLPHHLSRNDQFKAFTGWLDSFKKRHDILWNGGCGESKDVDESVVSEYKPKLLELISAYDPKNIYFFIYLLLFYNLLNVLKESN
jgi:hypothetical protein